MIDLRTCTPGDVLLTKNGTRLTYIGPLGENGFYDHEVQYPDGSKGTRIHDGHVFRYKQLPGDEDVVEILHENYDGTVRAEVHSDDYRAKTCFDATDWFIQATDEEIYQVAWSGWEYDYPTDDIAQWAADVNEDVAKVFVYIEFASGGFGCSISADSAMAWLKVNRHELAKRIEDDENIETKKGPESPPPKQ